MDSLHDKQSQSLVPVCSASAGLLGLLRVLWLGDVTPSCGLCPGDHVLASPVLVALGFPCSQSCQASGVKLILPFTERFTGPSHGLGV